MNQIIIKQALTLSQEARPAEDSRKNEEEEKDNLKQNESTEKPLTNKGKLQMDITVADAYIKFPTDLGLQVQYLYSDRKHGFLCFLE